MCLFRDRGLAEAGWRLWSRVDLWSRVGRSGARSWSCRVEGIAIGEDGLMSYATAATCGPAPTNSTASPMSTTTGSWLRNGSSPSSSSEPNHRRERRLPAKRSRPL